MEWYNIPKKICLRYCIDECAHFFENHEELAPFKDQLSEGLSIYRAFKTYDSTDEFTDYWRTIEELK